MGEQRPSVLLVDDDPAMLKSLARVLAADCVVATARSADEAIHLLVAGRRFDAIVSDMWMPGTDGQRLFEEVRVVAPSQADRMIYLTGGGLPERLERFLVDRIVVNKPCAHSEVMNAIRRVSERPRPL
jgi:DNA-binding NtrC family response regulator